MLEIYFLGTGGGVPSKRRNLPAYLIKTQKISVLLDCGEGTQNTLINYGLGITSIDVIGITHLHADHVLGLPGLIQTMNMFGRSKPLYIMGPRSLSNFLKSFSEYTYFNNNFQILFVDEFENEDLYIKKFPTCHTIESYGFILKEKDRLKIDAEKLRMEGVKDWRIIRALKEGKEVIFNNRRLKPEDYVFIKKGPSLAYTGDTAMCESVINSVKGADLLLHDSTFTSEVNAKEYGHSTAKEAAEVALIANVKRLGLIHISSRYENLYELEYEARRIFEKVFVPEDLSYYYLI
jgi:ribonuclease Z